MTATPEGLDTSDFRGFYRDGRRYGVRNGIVVLPSVICSGLVAESIAEAVPDAICTPHDHGCGQVGSDRDQTKRTLLNVCENPNVAGVVIVGLGCETLDSETLAAELDVPVRQTAIQTAGGTDEAIKAGTVAARELASDVRTEQRESVDASELTLGITVSDQSPSTVRSVNPLLGTVARHILDSGGRVVIGGIEPLVPFIDHVDDLVADSSTAEVLQGHLARHSDSVPMTRCRRAVSDLHVSDITSMWDNDPIVEVLEYGDRLESDEGVILLDSENRFEETATALAASGSHLIAHGSADGIPVGHPIAPVLSITGEPNTAMAMADDIDVDVTNTTASTVIDLVFETVNGEPTAAERHGLSAFALERVGPSM